MKNNKIRELMNSDKPVTSTRVWSTWPFYTEVIASTGNFDYFEFVGEYAPFSQMDLENLVRAAELHNMASMIKVDFLNRGYVAQKAVASGFQAVLFADHHTPDEVRESVTMMKAASPEYKGGFGCPSRRYIGTQSHMPQLDHAKRVNDVVLCFMIEKEAIMEHIEEVCSIPGVDMVQFGPSDYSMSVGKNRNDYVEEYKAVERRMIEVALQHGVAPRCEVQKPEEIQYYIDLGVKHFSMGDQLAKLKELWIDDGQILRDMTKDL